MSKYSAPQYPYSTKSDGSPETQEFREKSNSEKKKRGRPFQTAEERRKAIEKRKTYMENYRSRKKTVRRKRGQFFTYQEAKEFIQAEGVTSANEYREWHRLVHPAKMPSDPSTYYVRHGGWSNWGDFLGVVNVYPRIKKGNWRPYKEAKVYVHSKGFENREQWVAHTKSAEMPSDIPARPDITYFKTGEWLSWRDFLGPKCAIARAQGLATLNDLYLYVLKVPDPNNIRLYRIGVTVGGTSAIRDAVNKYKLKFVSGFIVKEDFDWKTFVLRYGQPDWESTGVYQIENIHEFNLALSEQFTSFPYF